MDILELFGDQFNDSLCNDKISELTKAKKLLNEICETDPNEALIQDLGDKLAASAIEQMLAEDKKILTDALNSIRDLIDPVSPQVFCGPEAEKSNSKPLVDNFLEPGTIKISRQSLVSMLKSAEKMFETELANFPSILKNKNSQTGLPDIQQIMGKAIL